MYKIEIIKKENLHTILPLIKLLNPGKEEKVLMDRLEDMTYRQYECVGVYDDGKLIAVSGIWILNKLYVGKHIEPDNVVVHPDYRGKQIGEQMIQWICDYGKQQGCIASELNCYLENEKGIKFWKDQGYKILGYHFQKQL